nr:hypothetical protein OG546_35460 [Streptomyces antimycoticus]
MTEILTEKQRVVVLAVMTSIASFGGFAGPLLIGKIAAGSSVVSGLVVPAICLSVAILLLALVRPPANTESKGIVSDVTHNDNVRRVAGER